ncbi:structural maintenance of chromosomes protein 6-like isoform X2 [Dreissena polymorpha]|nr:structural maintenance of chromosomes protein 6-like isoform X2 [Dreissena polymorpha]
MSSKRKKVSTGDNEQQKLSKKQRTVEADDGEVPSTSHAESSEEQETEDGGTVIYRRSQTSGPRVEEDMEEESVVDLSQNPGFNVEGDDSAMCGIIEKIELKNFMCHPRLSINFGPAINFIVGHNGSGKSAVITALVVGLGGKASVTNRGTKMKGFILTGKQTAEVEIRLRNQGQDAFMPKAYGRTIIINRKFNSDGTSQYKLKGHNGKVVSTKKDDLMRILDQFNIQVENPLAILNQETSRNFLNSKSTNDKYRFFLKATQLEQIKEDYERADEHKNRTIEIINDKVGMMPKLEAEILALERQFKALTAVDDLKTKAQRLRHELAWAFIIEKEKGMDPLVKEKNHEEARLPSFKQHAEDAKRKLDEVNTRMNEMTSRLSASGGDVKSLQPKLNEAKADLAEQKKTSRNAQLEVKRLEGAVRSSKKEEQEILNRIKEIQSSAKHDYEAERQARQQKVSELEAQLAGLEAEEKTTDHMVDQHRSCVTKYRNDQFKLNQESQTLQTQLAKNQRNLQAMKASQGNRLRRFGPQIPDLIKAIDQAHAQGRFHKKPIGPIGACFTLKDNKWALPVECCLKGLMNAFCCHDYQDEKALEQIIQSVCPGNKITIITSRFKDQVYDTKTKGADTRQYPSVLDMIQSDEPMVYNTLIDQQTVECVLLIEDGRTARQVMDPEKNPPRNARQAFTLNGDQVISQPTFRYYSSNQDKVKYLTTNVEDDIAAIEADIVNLQKKVGQMRQTSTQLEGDIQSNQQLERKGSTQLMKIRDKKRKITMEITELKNIEDPAPVDVATYEEEVKLLRQQIEANEAQLLVKQTVYREQEEVLKEADDKFRKIETEVKSKIGAADQIKEEVGVIVSQLEECKRHKKHYDAKLKEQELKIRDVKDRIVKYQQEIDDDIAKAKEIHEERITTRRGSRNLGNEIAQIERQIKAQEKQHGDPAEIGRQYKEKRDSFTKIRKEVHQLKAFCESLDVAMSKRFDRYSEFRRYIALRIKTFFAMFLNERGYSGKITFSHKEGTLDMIVHPTKSGKDEGNKDLRSLSGGERSFSTICLILALWKSMECPFRCLDEFDVFMDMVNRRISMEILMNTAKEAKDRQFIFLSPLNMSNLGISSNRMRIFEMPTPERGQQTLDPDP